MESAPHICGALCLRLILRQLQNQRQNKQNYAADGYGRHVRMPGNRGNARLGHRTNIFSFTAGANALAAGPNVHGAVLTSKEHGAVNTAKHAHHRERKSD